MIEEKDPRQEKIRKIFEDFNLTTDLERERFLRLGDPNPYQQNPSYERQTFIRLSFNTREENA